MSLSIQRKKDGGPSLKFFESLETVALLEPVRVWLLKNVKKYIQNEPINNKTLATIIVEFLQFQEEAFGKNVSKPALTRLPVKCFLDFKPSGSLCHLFTETLKFKAEQGWRKFDFQNPSRMDRNVEMFMQTQKTLIQNRIIIQPAIYLKPEIDKILMVKLKDIIKRHLGTVVEKQSEATHIVYPQPATRSEEELFRPVMKRDTGLMIHCYYTPDSYDTWLPDVEVDIEVDSSIEPDGPWLVNALWLLDLEEYNEWMNEDDYLVEDETENPRMKSRIESRSKYTAEELVKLANEEKKHKKDRVKRRRSPSPSSQSVPGKKKKGARNTSANSKRRTLNPSSVAGSSVGDEDDLSRDFEDPVPEPNIQAVNLPRSLLSVTGGAAGLGAKNTLTDLDEEFEGMADSKASGLSSPPENHGNAASHDDDENNLTEQTHHIIIPSYSAWFDYSSIHAIERRALPEFFNGKNRSKTPEVYLAYRNFMIDTYRLNPQEYLTSTACRRNLAGDVCAVIRVHAFLEQWGLINYQVDVDIKPNIMGPPSTSHFLILSDAPSGLQPFVPAKAPPGQSASKQMLDMDKSDKRDSDDVKKEATFGLKMDQYAKKLQESKQAAGGLQMHRSGNNYREWTDQETLLLLEGLEMFRDDWNRVAEHIGSRTQDECILHFLRLPIETPYLEDDGTGGSHLGPLAYQPVPFSQSGNPVMSTVAFLASIVDPRIAGAAAKAALEEFSRIKEEVPPWLVDNHLKNLDEARKEGVQVDANFGLEKTGIAGTVPEVVEKDSVPAAAGAVAATNAAAASATTAGDSDGQKDDGDESTTKKDAENKEKPEDKMDVDDENAKKDDATDATDSKKVEGASNEGKDKESMTLKKEDNNQDVEKMETDDEKCAKLVSDTSATTSGGGDVDKKNEEQDKQDPELNKEKNNVKDKDSEKLGQKRVEGDLNTAAAAALAAAAVKAKHLAAVEERKIKSLVALLVETQMKKLEIKLRHFEELEAIMDKERDALEYQRQELLKERQQFHMEQLRAAEFRAKQLAAQQLANEQKPTTAASSTVSCESATSSLTAANNIDCQAQTVTKNTDSQPSNPLSSSSSLSAQPQASTQMDA
ncbi:hypothetical protein HELRODRAFT_193880 [Helobdella robusta]|uniref:SWI/SNF complex subunit SMARCC2 n=1 Tax=Helobdella robusta TaxID=6412 RepID=T1FVF8_HELRO|nr:hypothetical protein HELRODRAFT_193880 [Helobdella robusta]ESN93812.1 hypothetical protein HELRODRAFT_193880 [Helobdella robusta]